MKLTNLLRPIKYSILQGESEPDIEKVTHDSREVERDTLFVCIKGSATDGALYVGEAVEKGAVAILADRRIEVPREVTFILVENVRETLAKIASVFYGEPSKEMTVIGITGTKGKTPHPASAPDIAGTRSDAVVLSGFGGGYLLPFSSASHKPDRYTAPSARS